jgi:sugar lactone lactonase YvrE
MRSPVVIGAVLVGVSVLSGSAFMQQEARPAPNAAAAAAVVDTGEYEVVAGWPRVSWPRAGYTWGSAPAVFAESPDRVLLGIRGEVKLPPALPPGFTGSWGSLGEPANRPTPELRNCIVVVDRAGRTIESWTQWDHLFQGGRGPHKIKISPYDPERHVWVVDDRRHQVRKFTNDGKKLVMALGELGVPGTDEKHFNEPTDVAFFADGSFVVSDGYINRRVVKFDKTGKFLKAWGSRGIGPGQFSTPHTIDTDASGRIYVGDRTDHGEDAPRNFPGWNGTGRVSVFDADGAFLYDFPAKKPGSVFVSANDRVWVADGARFQLVGFDLKGTELTAFGTRSSAPGGFYEPHQLSVDSDGNVYVADAFEGRTQKFRPKPGADRARLIGAPVPLKVKSTS